LFRNPPDAACFTKHPNPESKRPNFDAFKVLTTYFNGVEPLWRLRPGGSTQFNGPQELIAYYRPASNEIIIGMWSRNGETHLAEIPASSSSATLHYPDGTSRIITPDNGQYQISLPAATNQNANWDSSLYPIGGRPVIFSETDQLAPVVIGEASFGPGGIELTWSGDDNLGSGIESYEVTVSVDGGPPRPWLNSRESGPAMFRSQSGESYQFWITARDRAGNVSSPHLIVPDDPGEASTS
jgi:hypothetical protein